MSPQRILILHASTGNGHRSAAYALEAVLSKHGHTVRVEDTLDFAPKGFRLWYAGGYETVVRYLPRLWGFLYRDSDRLSPSFYAQTRLDMRFLTRLDSMVQEFRPDWVLCTHSLPQPRLNSIRQRGTAFKLGVVITDLHPQWMWLRGEPDLFFVPTPWTVTRLVERYPNARGQVHVTGIPVHPAFEEPRSAKTARKCLNLQEEPLTLLLTAGGIGAGPFQEVIALLSRLEQRVQVVVVCGRNAGLQERLKRYIAHLPPSQVVIHLKGQVTQEEMALLMHASDAVLGKPGGLTSSEAMVAHCPMLIYTPFMIPGQEEQNAEALLQGGAARIAKTLNDLESLIKEFLSSEALRASMRQATEPLSAPAAAEKIASKIAE